MTLRRFTMAVPLAVSAFTGLACSVSVDRQAYIEREEKRFSADHVIELRLTTFDGAVEIRSWDRPEIVVSVEKRGEDKEAVSRIQVTSEQSGDTIRVEAHAPGRSAFGLGRFTSPSARFVATVPRKCNLIIRTTDGTVTIDRVDGRIDVHSEDGDIKATEMAGALQMETADGAITLEDVTGRVEARTGDGSVRISGTPETLHVRTEDGAVALRIRRGAAMAEDWMVTTDDGSVTVELPGDFNATIEADPGSDGHAKSDIALTSAVGGTKGDPVLRGSIGHGGHKLTLRTSDGTIRVTNY